MFVTTEMVFLAWDGVISSIEGKEDSKDVSINYTSIRENKQKYYYVCSTLFVKGVTISAEDLYTVYLEDNNGPLWDKVNDRVLSLFMVMAYVFNTYADFSHRVSGKDGNIRRVMSHELCAANNAMIRQMAKTCHEVTKSYCESIGEFSQPWDSFSDGEKESWDAMITMYVSRYMSRRMPTPEDIHDTWMFSYKCGGWKYGPVKNSETKEHPSMVPYDQLPKEEQVKDALIMAVIGSFDYNKQQYE